MGEGRRAHTRGSLFLTRRTIFTDSSSKSSSILSGRGGRTGSKFFWATVSCTMSTACREAREKGWLYALTRSEVLGWAGVERGAPVSCLRNGPLPGASCRFFTQKLPPLHLRTPSPALSPPPVPGDTAAWVCRDCGVTTLRWGVDSSCSSSRSSLCTEAACSSSITCKRRRREAGVPLAGALLKSLGEKPSSLGLRHKDPRGNGCSTQKHVTLATPRPVEALRKSNQGPERTHVCAECIPTLHRGFIWVSSTNRMPRAL